MKTHCPLCRSVVSDDAQHWCRCGQPMGSRCYDAHREWCAVDGSEAWIGALEW
ncbi:hypothetical protein [Natrinema sp. HArc-T2]|uniref:hypothetical protein n=1 Tax=Natrinema sp. HArc-T2 TaxID=3242701 RepID=UPI00359D3D7F